MKPLVKSEGFYFYNVLASAKIVKEISGINTIIK